jgi:hypothetical protein
LDFRGLLLNKKDAKEASHDNRRIYSLFPAASAAAFAAALCDSQEGCAAGEGGDQVGESVLRAAAISVRVLGAQGAVQLRSNGGGAGGVSQGTGEAPDDRNFLQIPYDKPVPEKLIRKIAKYRLREVLKGDNDGFW